MNILKRFYTVILLAAGHALNDFYCNFLPVLLPIIMPRLDLSLSLSGLLVMVMSITSNVLQPVFGYIMDKKNLCRVLIPSVPFGAVCICSIGYVDSKYMLFLLIALTGLSISTFHPLGSSLVSKTAEPHLMGTSMSLYVAGGNIGFACAPLVIVTFTQKYPLEYLPVLILPGIFIAAAYFFSRLPRLSTVQQTASIQASDIKLGTLLTERPVLALNLSMSMRAWAHTAVATFLPLLLIQQGYSPLASGGLLTVFLVGAALGGLFGGYTGDKIGHKKLIILSLALGLLPTAYFFTHLTNDALAILSLFLCGASLQAPQPSSLIWAQQLMPNNAGMASGMMMGLTFGFGSAGTALTAVLADYIGLPTALLLIVVPMFIASVTAIYTPFFLKH